MVTPVVISANQEKKHSYSDLYLKDELMRSQLFTLIKENTKVMQGCDNFTDSLRVAYLYEKTLDEQEARDIMQALLFAAKKHKDQTRKDKDKTPYIIHPIGVADYILGSERCTDKDTIIAAFLHDTLEDTETIKEEIKEMFGRNVMSMVLEVTDDKSLSKKEVRKRQIETAPLKTEGAAFIKFADKLYNCRDFIYRTPVGYSQEKVKEYLLHAKEMTDSLPSVAPGLKNLLDCEIEKFLSSCGP
ncbi:hypothetical protein COB11_07075 [Candidatus Aerophobetes bacterium]|uniref:HD domain-containing protein n=1 Tax=Aerophobetes bacterium TaxID=2030807 RepID=A0A2A4YDJ7_UNCAE|nr:MAG: hypothetical protein COB11_07075 [Candidatus Aerophobetes bacterium]